MAAIYLNEYSRDNWFNRAINREAGEPIKQVRHGSAGGNVRRKRGVERTRIVCVARVDQRVAIACFIPGARTAGCPRHECKRGKCQVADVSHRSHHN